MFLIVLFVQCVQVILKSNLEQSNYSTFFANVRNNNQWIEIYGAFQKILGKQHIEKFTIFKNDYNKLVSPRERLNEETIKNCFFELNSVFAFLDDKEIPYVYLKSFFPIESSIDCPYEDVD